MPLSTTRPSGRMTASASGEVEMTLLEHATELVEEASLLLERLGRVAG